MTRKAVLVSPGFTLIEILVVLAVMGLLVGLVVGRGPQRSAALDLRATAGRVAAGLRAARVQAVIGGHSTIFLLDLVQHDFRLDNQPVVALPPTIALSMRTVAGAPRGAPPAPKSLAPAGSSSGGSITLATGRRRMRVLVDWLTGRVSVSDAE